MYCSQYNVSVQYNTGMCVCVCCTICERILHGTIAIGTSNLKAQCACACVVLRAALLLTELTSILSRV